MQGKKPTYNQRKILEKIGIDPKDYLVQKVTQDKMQLINKNSGEIKEIDVRLP